MSAPAVRRRAILLISAAAAFVLLTVGAMAAYHGGSRFDVDTRHYAFFGNFFSDLGATVTYSGRPNSASRTLFVIALATVGFAFAWSAPMWRAWAHHDQGLLAATTARVAAVVTGFGFAGIGITPWNRALALHLALVRVSFGLLVVFVASLIVLQVRNGTPRPWIVANALLVALLAVYVVFATAGPGVDTFAGLRFQIVTQKVAVYAAILNLSVQAWGVMRRAGDSRRGRDPVPSRSVVAPIATGHAAAR